MLYFFESLYSNIGKISHSMSVDDKKFVINLMNEAQLITGNNLIKETQKELKSFLQKYINANVGREALAIDFTDYVKNISLPFKCIWIEAEDVYTKSLAADNFLAFKNFNLFPLDTSTFVVGLLAYETHPGSIFYLADTVTIQDSTGEAPPLRELKPLIFAPNLKNYYMLAALFTYYITEKIHEYNVGTVKLRKHLKSKIAGEKFSTRITDVIYISKSKNQATTEDGLPINYSYRFWRRGHWRKLDNEEALGKDRAGNRSVKGLTWVIETIVGPEDKPLIMKTRKFE